MQTFLVRGATTETRHVRSVGFLDTFFTHDEYGGNPTVREGASSLTGRVPLLVAP
jgi:hypothetical protein